MVLHEMNYKQHIELLIIVLINGNGIGKVIVVLNKVAAQLHVNTCAHINVYYLTSCDVCIIQ